MKHDFSSARSRFLSTAWRGVVAGVAASVLIACGGGGVVPYNGVQLRPLSPEYTSRKAVAYSPYRTAVDVNGLAAEVVPPSNIKQDLDLLLAAGFGLIRVFDSGDKVARQTLQVIRQYALPIKMHLGAYMQSGDEAHNQAEIARTVALANEYSDIVLAVSVGNETMVSWSFNHIDPSLMAGYIKQVRDQITQPVTTDDNWAFFANSPRSIIDAIDFVALHTYPELDTVFDVGLWDWQQRDVPADRRAEAMMDASLTEARRQFAAARARLDSSGYRAMPIVIGETGWNAVDLGRLSFRAHPVNQKMYLQRLQQWTTEAGGPVNVFYFEAFDEPWKLGDDKWGLFNTQRQARYAIQDLGTCNVTWVCEPGSYTDASALYFVPPPVTQVITEDKFKLYSEATPSGSEFVALGQTWDAFGGNTASRRELSNDGAPGDGSRSLEIKPIPADYGWGYLLHSASGASSNLSAFAATGHLHFSVKTTYAGKLEIGFATDTDDRAGAEAYLQLSNGSYGYCNTGVWCEVSIPMSAFLAANPKLDPSLSLLHFVVADIFSRTGNTQKTNLPVVQVDAIYWTK